MSLGNAHILFMPEYFILKSWFLLRCFEKKTNKFGLK